MDRRFGTGFNTVISLLGVEIALDGHIGRICRMSVVHMYSIISLPSVVRLPYYHMKSTYMLFICECKDVLVI